MSSSPSSPRLVRVRDMPTVCPATRTPESAYPSDSSPESAYPSNSPPTPPISLGSRPALTSSYRCSRVGIGVLREDGAPEDEGSGRCADSAADRARPQVERGEAAPGRCDEPARRRGRSSYCRTQDQMQPDNPPQRKTGER
ncbi:unnamed protein product [Diplocarpon coronariae]